MKLKTLFNILLVILALFLAILATRSVLRPEKYKSVYNQRLEEVRARLTTIRTVQAVYRSEFKKFAGDVDTLVAFVNHGTVKVIKTIGEIPEGMSEEAAFKAGLIQSIVEQIPAKDKIFEADPKMLPENLKNFEYIPNCDGKKFEIQLGTLTSGAALKHEIPVYRIDVPLDDVLANLDRTLYPSNAGIFTKLFNKVFYGGLAEETQYRVLYSPIWMGSLTDASTSGSWE